MAFKVLSVLALALVLVVATAAPVDKDEGRPKMMEGMHPAMMHPPNMPFGAVRQNANNGNKGKKVKGKAVFYGGYPYYGGYPFYGGYRYGFGPYGFY